MKFKSLSVIVLSALVFAACSDNKGDDPGNNNGKDPSETVDDSADLDYTAKNAKSWGNYMSQVSNLLVSDATTLYRSWTESYEGDAPFADIFKKHNSAAYPSAVSCAQQIVEGCADIANEVGTAKIGDPYNLYVGGNTKDALYAVESWYSWHSREDYSNNIYSIRNSYFGSLDGTVSPRSLSALIAVADPDLDAKVKSAIDKAAQSILAIPQPFRSHINSDESRAAMSACADLEDLLTNSLLGAVARLGEEQLAPVIANYVDVVVLPTYKSLMERNTALNEAVMAFKANPSDNAFATACSAWLRAREPWERSEAFLFGPVDALGLDPNMDSWPLDQDAIVQILNSGNYDDLDWSDGDDDDRIESVQSVRGFHTLEFLLFKDGQPRKIK